LSEKEENEEKIENSDEKLSIYESFYKESKDFTKSEFSIRFPESELKSGTGTIKEFEIIKVIEYPFDRYIVNVNLSADNKFLGISEIKLNKDFRSYKEKIASIKTHNIEELYYKE